MLSDAKKPYETALKKSGYKYELKYEETQKQEQKKTRKRNITWYNPPFDLSIKTNIGKKFFKAIKNCFPPKHPLYSVCNRNTIKLSYSCMPNVANTIKTLNQRKLNESEEKTDSKNEKEKKCNCRKTSECPLQQNCVQQNVIYQSTITTNNSKETYVGLASTSIKQRIANHKQSFKDESKRFSTELSKYIWHLKDKKINYNIEWKILQKASPYSPKSKKCNLCLAEKYFIICKDNLASLNKRCELVRNCIHEKKFMLENLKIKVKMKK